MPACQGVIVGLADIVDRHYHPKPSWPPRRTGVLGSTGLPLLLPLVGGRYKSASSLGNLLCCFPHRELPLPMVVPTAGALQRLGLMLARHTNIDNHHGLQTSRLPLHNDGKIFFSSNLGRLKKHYFPYSSLLRLFLQGSLSSHRSACTFSSTICLIGVRAVHLVQRILSKVFFTAKSARPKGNC